VNTLRFRPAGPSRVKGRSPLGSVDTCVDNRPMELARFLATGTTLSHEHIRLFLRDVPQGGGNGGGDLNLLLLDAAALCLAYN